MNNVSQLAQMFLQAREARRIDPTLHGSAQTLSWLRGELQVGEERVLFCPADPDRKPPETLAEGRSFHPLREEDMRGARGLGSYAVRDFERFPVEAEEPNAKVWILCDRQGDDGRTPHHPTGIVVAYATGDTQFLTREELGLAPDDPIVVGPSSPHPQLRKFEAP